MSKEVKTLEEWRKAKGKQISYIAENLGYTTESIRNKEDGKSEFRVQEIKWLCNEYGIGLENIKFLHPDKD